MELKRIWRRQTWISAGVALALLGIGVQFNNTVPIFLGCIIAVCSIILAEVKLRCPSCGCSVGRESKKAGRDGVFYCHKCGQRIELK